MDLAQAGLNIKLFELSFVDTRHELYCKCYRCQQSSYSRFILRELLQYNDFDPLPFDPWDKDELHRD